MEENQESLRALRVFNLKEDASLKELRSVYLERTSQKKFQRVFLEDESVAREFNKYYEAYIRFLKNYSGSDLDLGDFHPDTVFRFPLNQGIYFLIKRQYMKAAEKFQEAYQLKKNDVLLLIYLGIILIKRRNYYAAEKYLIQATELDKNHDDAWYYLGAVYQATGNLNKALKMYEACKLLNPLHTGIDGRIKEVRIGLGMEKPDKKSREKKSILNRLLGKLDKKHRRIRSDLPFESASESETQGDPDQ